MQALPLQDVPSDSPAASRSAPPGTTRRRAEPPAGPPAPTQGSCLPTPTDPTRPTLVHGADRWRASKLPRRSRSSAPRTQPSIARWAPQGPRHGVPDMPAVRPAARFRQGAVAGHPPGHRLRRSVPPADTSTGWPGDGHGRPLDRPVHGHPQFEMTAQPMGGPSPDGGGQAADTSSA
jgi:hypothetical protein